MLRASILYIYTYILLCALSFIGFTTPDTYFQRYSKADASFFIHVAHTYTHTFSTYNVSMHFIVTFSLVETVFFLRSKKKDALSQSIQLECW